MQNHENYPSQNIDPNTGYDFAYSTPEDSAEKATRFQMLRRKIGSATLAASGFLMTLGAVGQVATATPEMRELTVDAIQGGADFVTTGADALVHGIGFAAEHAGNVGPGMMVAGGALAVGSAMLRKRRNSRVQ